jgi:cytochrome b561
MIRNTETRYGAVSKSLHWSIMLLVVGQIYLAITAFGADDPMREAGLLALHRPLGMTILVLMLMRLAWRLTSVRPRPPPGLSAATRGLALATHWLFYGLLIAIPLTGWAKAGAESVSVGYFGLFTVPNWTSSDAALTQTLRMTHLYLNTALLVLVPVHIAAATWHHFWRRDNSLRRMLPGAG